MRHIGEIHLTNHYYLNPFAFAKITTSQPPTMSNPPLQLLHGKRDSIICLTTKENSLLSSSEDGYITSWDLKSSSNEEWKLPNESIGTCTYTIDNYVYIGTDEGDLLQYDLRMTNEPIKTWNICDSELNVIRHKHDFLIGDDDGCIYSINETNDVKVLGYHDNVCTDIAVGENQDTIWSSGLDSTIRTWHSNENQCLNMGEPGDGFIYNLSLNEEETLLCSALGSGEVGLFQTHESTTILSKMQGHTAATTKAQFTEWDKSSPVETTNELFYGMSKKMFVTLHRMRMCWNWVSNQWNNRFLIGN